CPSPRLPAPLPAPARSARPPPRPPRVPGRTPPRRPRPRRRSSLRWDSSGSRSPRCSGRRGPRGRRSPRARARPKRRGRARTRRPVAAPKRTETLARHRSERTRGTWSRSRSSAASWSPCSRRRPPPRSPSARIWRPRRSPSRTCSSPSRRTADKRGRSGASRTRGRRSWRPGDPKEADLCASSRFPGSGPPWCSGSRGTRPCGRSGSLRGRSRRWPRPRRGSGRCRRGGSSGWMGTRGSTIRARREGQGWIWRSTRCGGEGQEGKGGQTGRAGVAAGGGSRRGQAGCGGDDRTALWKRFLRRN
ncbi:hypothetical protein DFJ74DRAFT_723301, partial [Hyaloraphidium curvatum]